MTHDVSYEVYARLRDAGDTFVIKKMAEGKPIFIVCKKVFTFSENEGLNL